MVYAQAEHAVPGANMNEILTKIKCFNNQQIKKPIKSESSEAELAKRSVKKESVDDEKGSSKAECDEDIRAKSGESNERDMYNKKRPRRMASQILRLYQCPMEGCHKSYGYVLFIIVHWLTFTYRSEASLNQHIKLKH